MKTIKISAIIFLFAFIALPIAVHASFIAPKRIMINHGQRAGGITIYNKSKEPMAYTFEWERRAQLPSGQTVVLKEGQSVEGYRPADEYLIFSPRRVIINPGQFQRLRILARRPGNLPDGEYHSNIKIKPEPLSETKSKEGAPNALSGQITMKAHLSVPVFLRQGKTALDFELTNISVSEKDGKDYINFNVVNNSTRSLYAKHVLLCVKDGKTIPMPIGATKLYVETKALTESWPTANNDIRLSSCQSLTLNIFGLDDPEYRRNDIIKSYKLR